MTNGQPYVRYSVPGHPHKSTWIAADQPAPAGHRRDREGPNLTALIVSLGSVLLLSACIIGAAALVGKRMAEYGVPRPSASIVTPSTVATPAVSHG